MSSPVPVGGSVVDVGVDLVDVDRFRRVLERTPGVACRVFTESERAYAGEARDPSERLAVRFAAKEAVLKALGVGIFEVPVRQIEVVRDGDSGKPAVRLHGRAREVAAARGIRGWRLSMTHTDALAEAIVVALG